MENIIKAYAVNNLCYITAQKMVPQGIVVHSTGANNPYLKRYVDAPSEVGVNRYSNHWNVAKPCGKKVCVHAFIGYDKDKQIRVAQLLPYDICCWGVGQGKKGSYNYDPAYIQFEICEDNLADKTYYEKAFAVAAEYCAELCKTYGISVDKVVGHCEAYRLGYGSNHSDPEHWMGKFDETMDDFRKRISKFLKKDNDEKEKNQENICENDSIERGDLVSINDNATYYDGGKIPAWVKAQNWYVRNEVDAHYVIIDENEAGTNFICSPIYKKFLTIVAKDNISEQTKKEETNLFPYHVRSAVDCLYIRKGAGINTAKVGKITDKGVYTIVEEKNGTGASKWGKLKSGIGWISLDCANKV